MTKKSSKRVIFLSFHFSVIGTLPARNQHRQFVVGYED
jgi:hypothetical protein